MNLLRIDRVLAGVVLPDLTPVSNPVFSDGDILVVSGGFEDRAMNALRAARDVGAKEIHVLAFEYRPLVSQNRDQEIKAVCDGAGWNYSGLVYDRCNPAGVYSAAATFLRTAPGRIFIDISGMSRLLIVQLVVGALRDAQLNQQISILYTEAKDYPPSQQEALAAPTDALDSTTLLSFISTGVFDLAVVPELCSTNLYRAPIRLIAFPSFNSAQLLNVRANIQPSQMTLLHGEPPDSALLWRKAVISKINKLEEDVHRQDITVSTLDYKQTFGTLLNLYDQWSEFNTLLISPTGSKMQTVAVGIFRAFVSDIQIIYPTPLRFTDPSAHTTGSKQMYEVKIDQLAVFCRALSNRAATDDEGSFPDTKTAEDNA